MTTDALISDLTRQVSDTIHSVSAIETFATGGWEQTLVAPDLHVSHVGHIRLPLNATPVQSCRSASIDTTRITVDPKFQTVVQTVARAHAARLGVRSFTTPVNAALSRLVIHETSDEQIDIKPNINSRNNNNSSSSSDSKSTVPSERDCKTFATLIVQLPAARQGGDLRVTHCGKEKVFSFSDSDSDTRVLAVSFFNQCDSMTFTRVTSGLLCFLEYNISVSDPNAFVPSLDASAKAAQSLAALATRWEQMIDAHDNQNTPTFLIYPLRQTFKTKESMLGNLKGSDAARDSVVRSCEALQSYYVVTQKFIQGVPKRVESFSAHAQARRQDTRPGGNMEDDEVYETGTDEEKWEIDNSFEDIEFKHDTTVFTVDGKELNLDLMLYAMEDYPYCNLAEGDVFKRTPHVRTLSFKSEEVEEHIRKGATPKSLGLKINCHHYRSGLILCPVRRVADFILDVDTPKAIKNIELGLVKLEEIVSAIEHVQPFWRDGKLIMKLLTMAVTKKSKDSALVLLRILVKWWPKAKEDGNGETVARRRFKKDRPGFMNMDRTRVLLSVIQEFGDFEAIVNAVLYLAECTPDDELWLVPKLAEILQDFVSLKEKDPDVLPTLKSCELMTKAAMDLARVGLDMVSTAKSKWMTSFHVWSFCPLFFGPFWHTVLLPNDLASQRELFLHKLCAHPQSMLLLAEALNVAVFTDAEDAVHGIFDAMVSFHPWHHHTTSDPSVPDEDPDEKNLLELSDAMEKVVETFTWQKMVDPIAKLAAGCPRAAIPCILLAFRSERHVVTSVAVHALRHLSVDAIAKYPNVLSTRTMAESIFMKTFSDEDNREFQDKLLANMFLDWIASYVVAKDDFSIVYNVIEEAHQRGDQLAVISLLAMLAGNDIRLQLFRQRSEGENNVSSEAGMQPICDGRWRGGGIHNDYDAAAIESIIEEFSWDAIGPLVLQVVQNTPTYVPIQACYELWTNLDLIAQSEIRKAENDLFIRRILSAANFPSCNYIPSLIAASNNDNRRPGADMSTARNQVGTAIIMLYCQSSSRTNDDTINAAKIAFALVDKKSRTTIDLCNRFTTHLSEYNMTGPADSKLFGDVMQCAVNARSATSGVSVLMALSKSRMASSLQWDWQLSATMTQAVLRFSCHVHFCSQLLEMVDRASPADVRFIMHMVGSIQQQNESGRCEDSLFAGPMLASAEQRHEAICKAVMERVIPVLKRTDAERIDAVDTARCVFRMFKSGHETREMFMSKVLRFGVETVCEVARLSLSELEDQKEKLKEGSSSSTTLVTYQLPVIQSVQRYVRVMFERRDENPLTDADRKGVTDMFVRVLKVCPEPMLQGLFVRAVVRSKCTALLQAMLYEFKSEICDKLERRLAEELGQSLALCTK